MSTKMDDLEKFVCNYWLYHYTDDFEKYSWAYETVTGYFFEDKYISQIELSYIEAIYLTARDEEARSYFAAGRLEDLVEYAFKEQRTDIARYILSHEKYPELVFNGVWPSGLINYLKKLASIKTDLKKVETKVNFDLEILTIELAISFWLQALHPGIEAYDFAKLEKIEVDNLLTDKTTFETIMRDLEKTKPNEESQSFLDSLYEEN